MALCGIHELVPFLARTGPIWNKVASIFSFGGNDGNRFGCQFGGTDAHDSNALPLIPVPSGTVSLRLASTSRGRAVSATV
jgi:hypothetical protein